MGVNLQLLQRILNDNEAAGVSWCAGATPMLHYSDEELKEMFGTQNKNAAHFTEEYIQLLESKVGNVTDTFPTTSVTKFDWRNVNGRNFISEVDENTVGACYAYATADVINAAMRISEDIAYGDSNGGLLEDVSPYYLYRKAMEYEETHTQGTLANAYQLMKYCHTHGVPLKQYAPWPTNGNTELNLLVTEEHLVQPNEPLTLVKLSRNDIKQTIMTYGPIAGTMLIGEDILAYVGGVYRYNGISAVLDENHSISIIGFDDNKKNDSGTTGAWLAKNNWGRSWGEDGFFWIEYGTSTIELVSVTINTKKGFFNPLLPRAGYKPFACNYNTNEQHICYLDDTHKLQETFNDGRNWSIRQLAGKGSLIDSAGVRNGVSIAYQMNHGLEFIAYLDESSKIRILCGNGSNLQSYSLPLASENTFVKAGSAPLIAVISPREFGYKPIYESESVAVFYVDANNNLHETLSHTSNGVFYPASSKSDRVIAGTNALTGAPQIKGTPSLTLGNKATYICYRDINDDLQLLLAPFDYKSNPTTNYEEWCFDGWALKKLTGLDGVTKGPKMDGNPSIAYFKAKGQIHICYVDKDGYINDIWQCNGKWEWQKLTGASGAKTNGPKSAGCPSVAFCEPKRGQHVCYQDINGEIQDLYWNDKKWIVQTLTKKVTGSPWNIGTKVRKSDPLMTFSEDGVQQHVYFNSLGSDLLHLCWTGSKWTSERL